MDAAFISSNSLSKQSFLFDSWILYRSEVMKNSPLEFKRDGLSRQSWVLTASGIHFIFERWILASVFVLTFIKIMKITRMKCEYWRTFVHVLTSLSKSIHWKVEDVMSRIVYCMIWSNRNKSRWLNRDEIRYRKEWSYIINWIRYCMEWLNRDKLRCTVQKRVELHI